MPRAKPLQPDLSAELLKMLDQHLLLSLHAWRTARSRPDRAQFLQILVRLGAVEGDVLQLQRRDGRGDVLVGRAAVFQIDPHARRYPPDNCQHGRQDAALFGTNQRRRMSQVFGFMASFLGRPGRARQVEAVDRLQISILPQPPSVGYSASLRSSRSTLHSQQGMASPRSYYDGEPTSKGSFLRQESRLMINTRCPGDPRTPQDDRRPVALAGDRQSLRGLSAISSACNTSRTSASGIRKTSPEARTSPTPRWPRSSGPSTS